MSSQRIFGLVLLAVGALLLLLGLRDAVPEGGAQPLAGSVLWYLVGGSAMALVGVVLAFLGGSGRLHSP